MARKPRRVGPDTYAHVWNRGHRKTQIFFDDRDRFTFLKLLREELPDHRVEPHAYCLLDNHFHLLVYDTEGRLSAAVQSVAGPYAQYFNERYEQIGALFQGRFGSRLAESEADLLSLSRYVHRNVLDAMPGRPMERYRWSSYGAYVLGRRSHLPVNTDVVLALAGSRDRYRSFVESQQPNDRRSSPTIDQASQQLFENIERAACKVASGDPRQGTRGRGTPNNARSVALLLVAERMSASRSKIAARYGLANPDSVSSAVSRLRRKRAADPEFAALVRQAEEEIARSGTDPEAIISV